MRSAGLEIRGINRKVNSPDNDAGFCSELINLRPENGLKIVHEKEKVSTYLPYTRVIIHKIRDRYNYIGFDADGVVWFDKGTGNEIKRLYLSTDNLDNIFVATLNGMVVISDKNKIYNTSYIFSNGDYKQFVDNSSMDIDIPLTHDVKIQNPSGYNPIKSSYSYSGDLESLQGIYNKFFEENKKYVWGYYLVGVNITLWDGTETRLSHLTPFIPPDAPVSESNVGRFLPIYKDSYNDYYFEFNGYISTHNIKIDGFDTEKYKDIIKSVNIYISRPISTLQFDEKNMSVSITEMTNNSRYNALHIKKSELEKQLLYKYKSFTLDQLEEGIDHQIEFGVDDLVNYPTLAVESGLTTRAGKMYTYNNRIHFYDTNARVSLKNGYFINAREDEMATIPFTAKAYAVLRDNNGDIIQNVGEVSLMSITRLERVAYLGYMVIVQDSRAYNLVLTSENTYAEIPLISSPAYNYSYAFLETARFQDGNKYENIEQTDYYVEPDVINVSAMANPFHFPVEYSYKFNGNITALSVATEAISSSQIGQYPLNVFTDNGIYALEQGGGQTLYSNIVPLTTDSCENKNVIAVKGGIVYIANNSVYLISGRQVTKLSELLEGPIDKYIQNNTSFPKCCINGGLYNIQDLLSVVDFREYIKEATLSWSAIENELIVSNDDYQYSYVYNFTYNCWYKVKGRFEMIGNDILLKKYYNRTEIGDVVEIEEYNIIIDWKNMPKGDTTQYIHLHTRPVHIQNKNSFKVIHKAVLNCLANLQETQNLSLYIYGSNNLQDWKCISASQRRKCVIANILTDRAAKAYKYFIFMIGGLVKDTTEISNIIVTLEDVANNKLR